MRKIEHGFLSALLLSRWLLAPFLVGLVCCIFLLIYRFFADLYEFAGKVQILSWHDLIVDVLNLVDVTLTANLVLIVIFAGYQNFIRKIEQPQHDALPGGLTDVDFSALKQKTSRLGRGHRGGRCAGLVSRSRKIFRHFETRLGARLSADVGRGLADTRGRRPAERAAIRRRGGSIFSGRFRGLLPLNLAAPSIFPKPAAWR